MGSENQKSFLDDGELAKAPSATTCVMFASRQVCDGFVHVNCSQNIEPRQLKIGLEVPICYKVKGKDLTKFYTLVLGFGKALNGRLLYSSITSSPSVVPRDTTLLGALYNNS